MQLKNPSCDEDETVDMSSSLSCVTFGIFMILTSSSFGVTLRTLDEDFLEGFWLESVDFVVLILGDFLL